MNECVEQAKALLVGMRMPSGRIHWMNVSKVVELLNLLDASGLKQLDFARAIGLGDKILFNFLQGRDSRRRVWPALQVALPPGLRTRILARSRYPLVVIKSPVPPTPSLRIELMVERVASILDGMRVNSDKVLWRHYPGEIAQILQIWKQSGIGRQKFCRLVGIDGGALERYAKGLNWGRKPWPALRAAMAELQIEIEVPQ